METTTSPVDHYNARCITTVSIYTGNAPCVPFCILFCLSTLLRSLDIQSVVVFFVYPSQRKFPRRVAVRFTHNVIYYFHCNHKLYYFHRNDVDDSSVFQFGRGRVTILLIISMRLLSLSLPQIPPLVILMSIPACFYSCLGRFTLTTTDHPHMHTTSVKGPLSSSLIYPRVL